MATTRIIAKHTEAPRQTDELADVVVAVDSRDRKGEPWYVRLRAWLFCLMFLALAECGTRVLFDITLCLHEERFDNFPNPAALDAYVNQIKRDPAYKVVVLGDSVVVGPSLLAKNETIPAYLESALKREHPGRDIHVWNLGIAGARSLDIYCVLLRVLEASPDLVVIENNLMMYTMDIRLRPLANTWLGYSLPNPPAEIRSVLPPLDYKQDLDQSATWFVERNCRLFGLRQALNGMLFGVQPRVPFDSPNPAVMLTTRAGQSLGKLKMEPWNVRGVHPGTFRSMYADAVHADNLNGKFYRLMMEELKKRGTPGFFYMTPQNPAMMADYFPDSIYADNRKAAASFMQSADFPSGDYSTLVPDSLFYDNDHLLAGGNQMVADAIARDAAPVVRTALAKRRQHGRESASTIGAARPGRDG